MRMTDALRTRLRDALAEADGAEPTPERARSSSAGSRKPRAKGAAASTSRGPPPRRRSPSGPTATRSPESGARLRTGRGWPSSSPAPISRRRRPAAPGRTAPCSSRTRRTEPGRGSATTEPRPREGPRSARSTAAARRPSSRAGWASPSAPTWRPGARPTGRPCAEAAPRNRSSTAPGAYAGRKCTGSSTRPRGPGACSEPPAPSTGSRASWRTPWPRRRAGSPSPTRPDCPKTSSRGSSARPWKGARGAFSTNATSRSSKSPPIPNGPERRERGGRRAGKEGLLAEVSLSEAHPGRMRWALYEADPETGALGAKEEGVSSGYGSFEECAEYVLGCPSVAFAHPGKPTSSDLAPPARGAGGAGWASGWTTRGARRTKGAPRRKGRKAGRPDSRERRSR